MEHKFCTHCGKRLEERYVFSHYDARNGGKLYSKYFVCPARRWYNAFLHDSWLVRGGSFGSSPQYYTEDYIHSTQSTPDVGTEWVCSKCKTTNMLDVPTCQACFHPRGQGEVGE